MTGQKLPPCNVEAEIAVLGSMLVSPNCIPEVRGLVTEEDFYSTERRTMFRAACDLFATGGALDPVTFIQFARDRGLLEDMGGQPGVLSLFENSVRVQNVEDHCGIIAANATRRAMIGAGSDLAAMAYSPEGASTDELLGKAIAVVSGLQRASKGKSVRWGEAYLRTMLAIEETRKRRARGELAGMRTGLAPIDDAFSGIGGPKLIIIAARPGVGKTAGVNLLALSLAKAGHPGYIASLEMSEDQLITRGLASEAGVNVTKLAQGDEEEVQHAKWTGERLIELPLWMDFETYSLAGIQANATLHHARDGVQWITVDHIGLVETQRFPSRNDQVGFISRSLKQLAKRLGVPVIALSQLSRKCDDDKRAPMLSDLRDSGNLEQDADAVVFLHTPLEQRSEVVRPLEFGIAKNRGGRTGWNKDWQFNGAAQRIEYRI